VNTQASSAILCGKAGMSESYAKGMKIRRKVLGDTQVDAAESSKTAFDEAFQNLITEGAWGSVWARDTISLRERSMLTLALLAATGSFEEIAMHIRATVNTGASPDDVMEALLHVAIYAGVPRANQAIKIARATYDEMGIEL
jgi:4-carboxymuconolactone decarboxylase